MKIESENSVLLSLEMYILVKEKLRKNEKLSKIRLLVFIFLPLLYVHIAYALSLVSLNFGQKIMNGHQSQLTIKLATWLQKDSLFLTVVNLVNF